MDRQEKVRLLARAAQFDLCAPHSQAAPSICTHQTPESSRRCTDVAQWLYPAALPNGKHLALLKILQTNMCDNNCFYCGMRRARNVQRCDFSPEELASVFDQLVHRGVAEGLFLSSAVCDSAARTQERMIATVELVRFRYHFSGYIHLKLLPGCDPAAVERAVQIANRVSVNLEAPNAHRLRRLSADKRFEQDLVQTMHWARRFLDQDANALADITTQFVVGAAGESDREILATTEGLHRSVGLTRTYFSAFRPVLDTPLDNLPATPLLRQNRLYQSDYLLRRYGFTLNDLCFDADDNLCRDTDPKLAWARMHSGFFPVEINHAAREELLRVPGIGPRSVARILRLRRQRTFRDLQDLRSVGAVAARAAPFILLSGRRPPAQLALC